MALDFAGGSKYVNIGSGSDIDDMATGTIVALAMPFDNTSAQRLYHKADGGNYTIFWQASGTIRFRIARATAELNAEASDANFSAFSVGAWLWMAGVWNTAGANGDQKLYVGSLTSPLAEPSAYAAQTVGSGAVGSNAAGDGFIGASPPAGGNGFLGKYARFMLFDRILSRGELRALQFGAMPPSGLVRWYELGWNGTGTQPDYAGSTIGGTVTGATVYRHAPVRNPFTGTSIFRYAVSAPVAGHRPYYSDLTANTHKKKRVLGLRTGLSVALSPIGAAAAATARVKPKAETKSRARLVREIIQGRDSVLGPLGAAPTSGVITVGDDIYDIVLRRRMVRR